MYNICYLHALQSDHRNVYLTSVTIHNCKKMFSCNENFKDLLLVTLKHVI